MTAQILSPQLTDNSQQLPTGAVSDLVIATDTDRLDISLWSDGLKFYDASLYAYDGKVTMEGARDLIEMHFREKGWSVHAVTVKVCAPGIATPLATKDICCLYCEYDTPVTSFDKAFLSLFGVQRTHLGSVVSVAADNTEALAAATLTAVGLTAAGAAASQTIPLSSISPQGAQPANYCHISLDDLMAELSGLSPKISTLKHFTVKAGDRQKTFYLDSHTDYFTLCFRSIFNCPEYIDIPGSTVMSTEVSRADAYVGGSISQYDQSSLRSYKVTTAPLTRGEAEAFAQVIESRDIRIRLRGVDYPIAVIDHTIDVSYDNDNLNTILFTWRFKSPRPRLFGTTLDPLLAGDDGIFTQEFTPEYQ